MSNSIRPTGEPNPKPGNVFRINLNVVTDPEECRKLEENQLARCSEDLKSLDWITRFCTVQWLGFSFKSSVMKSRFSEVAIPLLIEALNDLAPSIRREAVISLGEICDQRAIGPITKLLNDPEVASHARSVLKKLIRSFL